MSNLKKLQKLARDNSSNEQAPVKLPHYSVWEEIQDQVETIWFYLRDLASTSDFNNSRYKVFIKEIFTKEVVVKEDLLNKLLSIEEFIGLDIDVVISKISYGSNARNKIKIIFSWEF